MLGREPLISLLDRSKKRIVVALGLAVLMHLPATPMFPVLRMVHRIAVKQRALEKPNLPARPPEVEVQLERALHQEEQHQQQVQAVAARHETDSHASSLSMSSIAAVPFNQAQPTVEPVDDAAVVKPKEPKKEKLKDVGLEGDLAKTEEVKPGVTLGLWFSSLRDNPLGKDLVKIATCDREWRIFTEQGIDPMNDFDGVLVVGPSLAEPGQMTAAVRHSLPQERVHEVVDGLVKRSGKNGRWIGPGVATAKLGKAQRMLLPHQKDLFFVAPSKGWEALHGLKQSMKVPAAEGRFASIVLAQPNQTLQGAGLTLPKRISRLRLEVYANVDKSSDIKLELEDLSPKAAEEDLKEVSTLLSDFFSDAWVLASTLASFTGADTIASGPELAPRLDLSVADNRLSGTIHLSPGQTQRTVNLVASLMCRKTKPSAKTKP